MNEMDKPKYHLNFIVPQFRNGFEQQAIDTYMRIRGDEPPSIEEIFIPLTRDKPDYFFSAFLGKKHLNDRYYFELMAKANEHEKWRYLHNQLNDYEVRKAKGDHSDGLYEHLCFQDIVTVLKFKQMSFVDGYGSTKIHRNLPSKGVW